MLALAVAKQEGMDNVGSPNAEKENIHAGPPSRLDIKQSSREFPSTPAGRVPLSELMDFVEDVKERSPPGSPVEAVSWNKSPEVSSQSQSFMTPMLNRKRKRNRPAQEATEQTALPPPRNQSTLKTPQNDPAFDLESRYFGHRYRTPSKPASSAAPDFMHSSSPGTPAPPIVDSAKLKRTRSLGSAYLSANTGGTKRQKVEAQVDINLLKMVRTASKDSAEMQQISMMLDSIHEELPGSLRVSQMSPPAASCPLPKNVLNANGGSLHLTVNRDCDCQEHAVDTTISCATSESRKSSRNESFDYGTMTNEMAAFVGDGLAAAVSRYSEVLPLTVEDQSARTVPNVNVSRLHNVKAIPPAADTEGDEFDEFDDDEGLDLLASICDSRPTQTDIPGPELLVEAPPLSTDEDCPHSTKRAAVQEVIDISDDEFNEGVDDDFCDGLYAATQVPQEEESILSTTPMLQRYVIVSATNSSFPSDSERTRPEKILQLEDVKNKDRLKVARLRSSWIDGVYPAGCIVHVLGDFDNQGHCVIDDKSNWLIVHPDHLISATVVADSFSCTRRAVLQDRVKATSGSTEPLVYGHILHEVFQEGMKANRWDDAWLKRTITAVCSRYIENLFEINIELPLAVSNLMGKAAGLQAWADLFVSSEPKPEAKVLDRGGGTFIMAINKLLEVEEHIWSPKFGIKGNIDATVQVVMNESGQKKTLTVPLELKTGRNTLNISHQAQTALYTLLLSDRYDVDVTYGILLYLESSATSRIVGVRNEIISMIQQRNKIATYVRDRQSLPPMLQDARLCGRCYAKTPCFIYHRLMENGDSRSSGLKDEFAKVVQHLRASHKDFFLKWDTLLTKEEADAYRFRKELWTMLSSEREKVGRCFGGLVIDTSLSEEMADAPKINRYKYTLIKQRPAAQFSFTESQITVGEPIVISDERGHYALANGYVTSVRPNRITVLVDRRLHNARTRSKNFDAENHQSFSGIMSVKNGHHNTPSQHGAETVVYRLDKDEFSNGMATVRNNLTRLMDSDAYGSESLRRLIVELKPPVFDSLKHERDWYPESESSLNVDQRNAVDKVMSAKNYALVLGMPGTGKTTTIAHIIRALVAKGKSVLLTSYTHTAVDNILLKIRNDNISILRLGATAKVHPEVQTFAELATKPKTTFEELQRSYSAQVVATTCLGVNHAIFNTRIFDYCIVDEASQITLPVCLGPISMAKRFVLVGDHYQLPPLVQNKEAQEGGLDVSLFKLLSDSHPESVVNLEHQYRMCEDIMSLSNALIYSGRLKCGTPEVASASMSIPNMSALELHHHSADSLAPGQIDFCSRANQGSCWLNDTLDPSRRVIFLNTDCVGSGAQEIVNGTRLTNPFEVTIATQTVEALLTVGIPASDIGVITLYRSQLALLKHSLRHRSSSSYANPTTATVEMHTADKFQGRDKEVVVLSLVRSNDNGSIGDLLQDWRRVNVALTRARTKLIIIGSFNTINRGTVLLGKFCTMCHQRGWVYDLREGAGQAHYFDEWRTQTHGHVAEAISESREVFDVGGEGDSDIEVGSSGQSPKKTRSSRRPLASVNKPFQPVRFVAKQAKMDPRRVLSKRVVLGDIMNDIMGSAEETR